ncbi:MAG: hypothetical protein JSV06_08650 [Myxococcales bacterium]|nr:MAG: hypothetical protein JSV06_08650 [Myxococcales bacterium]
MVDNTKWVPTTDGEEFFGSPPADAVCELTPLDCGAYLPFPEGECIEIRSPDPCIASLIPEQLDTFCVLAVYTRMPNNPSEPMCNWITLEQPSLRDIRMGDRVEIRMRHNQLTAPVPGGEANMAFVIGDQIALEYNVLIPSDFAFPRNEWTADKDYPAGTQLLFHVDNHGQNEYMLIEVNVLEPGENTEL